MMRTNAMYRWIGLMLASILPACNAELEEEISWDLDEFTDMLVVEGTITNEMKRQSLYLSISGEYFNTESPRPVTGAIVSVSDGPDHYSFSESEIYQGFYVSDQEFQGVPLRTYELNILLASPLNGSTEFMAVSTMPEGITLDSIRCEIYEMPDLVFGTGDGEDRDTTILGIYYYGKEPDDPDNQYLAHIWRNGIPWQATAKDLYRFNDDHHNGFHSDLILFVENVAAGDTIDFSIQSIEKSYYDFIGSIQQMDQSGNAYSMSGPPANAVGNITNALGFFTASYVSKKTGIASDQRD